MVPDLTNAVAKIHPASRGIEPEDPMNLHAVEVDGDPQIMLQILVEEYARMGFGLEELMNLCRQPFYVGLHGLWLRYGEEALRHTLSGILSRCGVFRTVVREAPPPAALSGVPRELMQIEAATSLERNHHA